MEMLDRCYLLRSAFRPNQIVEWQGSTLEVISHPFPDGNSIAVMMRKPHDPTSMRKVLVAGEVPTYDGRWNPRYIQYALAHHMSPYQRREEDHKRWPNGHGTGFMLWIAQRKVEFLKVNPEAFILGNVSDQDAWDEFLRQRTIEILANGQVA